jgi:hypothetical protein
MATPYSVSATSKRGARSPVSTAAPDAEARAIDAARHLGVAVIDRRVEERDVARVDAALHRLEPVAVLHALGDEDVRLRQERELEIG